MIVFFEQFDVPGALLNCMSSAAAASRHSFIVCVAPSAETVCVHSPALRMAGGAGAVATAACSSPVFAASSFLPQALSASTAAPITIARRILNPPSVGLASP